MGTGRITGWSAYLCPWEGDGTCPPAAISRHLKDKKGIAEPKRAGERKACCVHGILQGLGLPWCPYSQISATWAEEVDIGWEAGWTIKPKCHQLYKVLCAASC